MDESTRPVVDLRVLLEANHTIRADLDRREEEISAREERARLILDDCARERAEIVAARQTIDGADRLYRHHFVPAEDESGAKVWLSTPPYRPPLPRQKRARIGEQRYRILATLRTWDRSATKEELTEATGLPAKRVHDAVRDDAAKGFVDDEDGYACLTDAGRALLSEYEDYRRREGKPLPPLSGPISKDDDDDESSDTPNYEEIEA